MEPKAFRASLKMYLMGFLLAAVLTLTAFLLVGTHVFDRTVTIGIIIALAVLQLFVQLVFFLHLGKEARPRWNLVTFLFMLMVLVIIVGGSLWIMDNLNYNMMMSPEEMDRYMIEQSNKGF